MNLRHILSLSHFSTSTLKSVFGTSACSCRPALPVNQSASRLSCALIRCSSYRGYTAGRRIDASFLPSEGCYESEMRNAGDTHAYAHLFAVVARTVGCTVQWHGRPDRLGLRSRESPSSCADMGPGAQVPDMFFSFLFLSFYQLVTNHSLCLVSEWHSGWHCAILLCSALSSTISNYLSIMGPRPTGLTFASC